MAARPPRKTYFWILPGSLFPIHQRLNGEQRKDRVRMVVNLTFWIL
jgi:hypothetical protein